MVIVQLEGLGKKKKCNDSIWIRIREFPSFSKLRGYQNKVKENNNSIDGDQGLP
jgi:hypothetical protein